MVLIEPTDQMERRAEIRPLPTSPSDTGPPIAKPIEIHVPRVDCEVRETMGYRRGKRSPITLISIGDDDVERATADAYWAMREAAANDGVELRIRSGFRTHAQQRWLYECYRTCSCNGCTLAARPGHSNHQSGTALDLVLAHGTSAWLTANAARFGFVSTVPREPWHWEYRTPGDWPSLCADDESIQASRQ